MKPACALVAVALLPAVALAADNEVVIGVTAGPHAQIAEVAKRRSAHEAPLHMPTAAYGIWG